MKRNREYTLNIGIPNGIILFVIGVLVLATPFVHEMDRSEAVIDFMAGVILVSIGTVSFLAAYANVRKRRKMNDN